MIATRLVLGLVAVLLLVGPAAGQRGSFRITYDVDAKSRPDQVRITGRVHNDSDGEVYDVSVTAEALDRRGKVLASGVSFVDSRISRGDSRPFTAVVPTVSGATRYRVEVTSFRGGFGAQSP
jgi:hypothetical protein